MGREVEKRREEENMREWIAQEGGKTVREKNKRDILIEKGIKGLLRNIALGKFPRIHKDDPS